MTDDDRSRPIRAALDDALTDVPHLVRDRALIALARRYADLLDEAVDRLDEATEEDQAADFSRMVLAVTRLGARLENTLDRMGMAPAARPATRGGEPHGVDDPAAAVLTQLRSRGSAPTGIDHTALVDPAVTEADA